MGYEIDTEKDRINRLKHGVALTVGLSVFAGPFIEEEDARFDYDETRFTAIGPVARLRDRLYSVSYTWRGAKRRIISVRSASASEIRKYRRSHS